jgi:hypothetical protein
MSGGHLMVTVAPSQRIVVFSVAHCWMPRTAQAQVIGRNRVESSCDDEESKA